MHPILYPLIEPVSVLDDFDIPTVTVEPEHLADFPQFMSWITAREIGLSTGVLKMCINGGFNRTTNQEILTMVKVALSQMMPQPQHTFKRSKPKKNEFQPQKQYFYSLTPDENIFAFRQGHTLATDCTTFLNHLNNFTVDNVDTASCCGESLSKGRQSLLDHYFCTLRNSHEGILHGNGLNIEPTVIKEAIEIVDGFSLSRLGTCLDLIPNCFGGISWPYFYLGLPHSSSPWHIEEGALWNINYLHGGKEKVWFVVPPQYYSAFEILLLRVGIPWSHKVCRNILGHKCVIVDPRFLRDHGIPVSMVVQREGEFVITWPFAAQAGFNAGTNFAEASNFATPEWIPCGMIAPTCDCYEDGVKLNISPIIQKYRPDLLSSYKSGNWFAAFPPGSKLDPSSCAAVKESLPSVGLLGPTNDPLQILAEVKAEPEDVPELASVSDQDDLVLNTKDVHVPRGFHVKLKSGKVIDCPVCPKSFQGGIGKIDRLLKHATSCHLQTHPDIKDTILSNFSVKIENSRGQLCLKCEKFVSGSSFHLRRHMANCKKKSESKLNRGSFKLKSIGLISKESLERFIPEEGPRVDFLEKLNEFWEAFQHVKQSFLTFVLSVIVAFHSNQKPTVGSQKSSPANTNKNAPIVVGWTQPIKLSFCLIRLLKFRQLIRFKS